MYFSVSRASPFGPGGCLLIYRCEKINVKADFTRTFLLLFIFSVPVIIWLRTEVA